MTTGRINMGRPCAECRRLKHKCDRQVPCSNCVKKGCSDICPDGTNSTGDGHKRFWSKTHELRDTLGDLATRISALEGALQASFAIHATGIHPLLEEDQLKLKEPFLRAESRTSPPVSSTPPLASPPILGGSSSSSDASVPPSESVETIGSMTILRNGRSKYFGPTALSPCFLMNADFDQHVPGAPMIPTMDILPAEYGTIADNFPLSLLVDRQDYSGRHDRLATLRCFLPSPGEAQRLKGLYYRYGAFMMKTITLEEWDDTIYPAVYEHPWAGMNDDEARAHHCLAVAFATFAVGSMVDPDLAPRNAEGQRFFELACAALFGSKVIEDPTIESIYALLLLEAYISFLRKGIEENRYRVELAILNLVIKMAHTMGLHRDPAMFDLPPKEVERRRRLWWDIYNQDMWNSMRWGLIPSIHSHYFDTQPPVVSNKSYPNMVSAWRYAFCKTCIEPIMQKVFAFAQPSYAAVLEMDQVLRSHPVPQSAQFRAITADDLLPHNEGQTFSRSLVSMYKEAVMVCLHRSFCDRATQKYSEDPLNSPYGTSVIAAYRSAWAILTIAGMTYEYLARPISRMSCVNHQVFTAATVLTTIIVRCPTLTLVPDALIQLDNFQQLAFRHLSEIEAELTLRTISDLRNCAHSAYSQRMFQGSLDLRQLSDEQAKREAILNRVSGSARVIDYSDMTTSEESHLMMAPLHLPAEEMAMHPNVLDYLQTLGV